ncbi:hypothetical protein VNO78_25714 [Psophocarpus tetragonolobus]|uniref:Uncharacterized protein n=1 Tax=Psophocarpus tetragonolobus TaxID=3891 RepID=A0AAN9S6D3_PSOTE
MSSHGSTTSRYSAASSFNSSSNPSVRASMQRPSCTVSHHMNNGNVIRALSMAGSNFSNVHQQPPSLSAGPWIQSQLSNPNWQNPTTMYGQSSHMTSPAGFYSLN